MAFPHNRICTVFGCFFNPNTAKETFFWLNSYTGDKLTNLNPKDKKSDLDAYTIWKNTQNGTYLYESFDHYYSSNDKRQDAYNKAFHSNAKQAKQRQDNLNAAATLSLGAFAILGVTYILPPVKKFASDVYKGGKNLFKKYISDPFSKILDGFKGGSKKSKKDKKNTSSSKKKQTKAKTSKETPKKSKLPKTSAHPGKRGATPKPKATSKPKAAPKPKTTSKSETTSKPKGHF